METAYQDFLRDVVITIHMNIRELKERKNFAAPEELAHINLKLLTYEEVLSILRDSADGFNIPKEDFGLL
jgi:hypothetical protein